MAENCHESKKELEEWRETEAKTESQNAARGEIDDYKREERQLYSEAKKRRGCLEKRPHPRLVWTPDPSGPLSCGGQKGLAARKGARKVN